MNIQVTLHARRIRDGRKATITIDNHTGMITVTVAHRGCEVATYVGAAKDLTCVTDDERVFDVVKDALGANVAPNDAGTERKKPAPARRVKTAKR